MCTVPLTVQNKEPKICALYIYFMSDSYKIRINEVTSEGTNWIKLIRQRILKLSLANMVIKLSITEKAG
jgi:hypothetical protein